jgi:hypothetical protein
VRCASPLTHYETPPCSWAFRAWLDGAGERLDGADAALAQMQLRGSYAMVPPWTSGKTIITQRPDGRWIYRLVPAGGDPTAWESNGSSYSHAGGRRLRRPPSDGRKAAEEIALRRRATATY